TALVTQQNHSRPRRGAQHGGLQFRAQAAGVTHRYVERVIRGESLPLDSYVRGNSLGLPKQRQGLIDQVWRKVEQYAAAGPRLFPPRTNFGGGSIAVIM